MVQNRVLAPSLLAADGICHQSVIPILPKTRVREVRAVA
jgi:hypothetical protein